MDGVMRMKVVIGSEIRIKDAEKPLYDWCSENLILPNPEYIDRTRRGLWTDFNPQGPRGPRHCKLSIVCFQLLNLFLISW